MRQAMKLVRDELGADAAIIGNRRIAGGVELTAALDYKLSALAPRVPNAELEDELRKTQSRIATAQAELSSRNDTDEGNRQLFAGLSLTASEPLIEPHVDVPPAAAAPAPAPVDPRLFDAMRSELSGLRELLEVQLGSLAWSQLQGSKPMQANLWRRLQRVGLSGALARELLDLVAEIDEPRQAWRMILAHLARMIDVPEIEPIEEGGVIAMVGPAGMGKTTTLAAGRTLRAQVRRQQLGSGEHGQLPHRRPGAAQDPWADPQRVGDLRRSWRVAGPGAGAATAQARGADRYRWPASQRPGTAHAA